MTQSAGHIEAGPNACPFVALENDRDARAPAPDERHRCYAENVPAPRTLAHQERFCLSPHFAGCPIFAEWAVRAAARPVPGAGTSAGTAAVAAAGTAAAAPELWFERFDKTVEPGREERWPDSMDAAPPAAAGSAAQAESERDAQQLAAFGAPPAGRDEPPLGTTAMHAPRDEEDRGFDPAPLPTFLTERSPRARTSLQHPVADESLATVAEPDIRRSSAGRRDGGDGPFTRLLTMAAVLIILALGVATVLIVPGLLAGDPVQPRSSLVAGASQRPTALASLVAGVPTTSPVDATVAPEPEPSTPVPEATPTPTPRSYKIQPGDRLRQIAREFGVTVEQILAANPEIGDPNDIQVGQRIAIPVP